MVEATASVRPAVVTPAAETAPVLQLSVERVAVDMVCVGGGCRSPFGEAVDAERITPEHIFSPPPVRCAIASSGCLILVLPPPTVAVGIAITTVFSQRGAVRFGAWSHSITHRISKSARRHAIYFSVISSRCLVILSIRITLHSKHQ